MKRFLIVVLALISTNVFAGNPDRIGENGAYQLLINGWPRSTGFWDMYTARITGVESMRLNPAGLAHVRKMDVVLAQTLWFQGSQTQVTQAGFAGKLGDDNVIGLELMSLNTGDFFRTTESNPDPNNGLGTFKPRYLNLGVTFARTFSNRIYGGATIRLISESIENIRSMGFALDAGLQYILGKKENLRFGVSIRNLGTPMKYSGDGFTFRGVRGGNEFDGTQSAVTQKYELPAQLTIGASYDFWIGPDFKCAGAYNLHRLTLTGQFTSNTYGKDNFGGGAEYSFKEVFMVRGGYRYESGLLKPDERTSAYTGISAGMSIEVPFKENGPSMGIDYSYRTSDPFGGTHSIGLRFALGEGEDPCGDEEGGKDAMDSEKKKKGKSVKLSKSETALIESVAASINFETGSDDLTEASKAVLNQLAELMKDKEKAFLNIAAYTDNVGNDDDNLQLSRERAFAVKTYLKGKGIDSDRMKAKGLGEADPIAVNDTEEGRAQNRRVELSIN
jgi:outer membrane protein OmpA-like peptidoglycan-associated protein|tara:strand:+ start:23255 stop:24763 length:1509 start_codon:yes stop_codon:yes gene_type:complete